MKIEVGAYAAKTRLPELLRDVRAGKQYTITHRGAAIADLVPAKRAKRHGAVAAVAQMKAFMTESPPVRGVNIKGLIEEGRA
jgi:prevent-host-death family protein